MDVLMVEKLDKITDNFFFSAIRDDSPQLDKWRRWCRDSKNWHKPSGLCPLCKKGIVARTPDGVYWCTQCMLLIALLGGTKDDEYGTVLQASFLAEYMEAGQHMVQFGYIGPVALDDDGKKE